MENSGQPIQPNERQICPSCFSPVPMKFVFPATRSNPCEEEHAWRFQRCSRCKWCGDVVSGTYMNLYRFHWTLFVDGEEMKDGLLGLLRELELCP